MLFIGQQIIEIIKFFFYKSALFKKSNYQGAGRTQEGADGAKAPPEI